MALKTDFQKTCEGLYSIKQRNRTNYVSLWWYWEVIGPTKKMRLYILENKVLKQFRKRYCKWVQLLESMLIVVKADNFFIPST